MRLDKMVSNLTDFSRSDVKKLIRAGKISVNNEQAQSPAQQVLESDRVRVNEELLGAAGPRYFMLYKPEGYVSATKDADHPVALDLIFERRPEQLMIAGRLDIDTTGLLLLTDDGQWAHRVTSPRHKCNKCYRVTTADPISADTGARFERGVMLHEEKRRTRPATLELIDSHNAWLTITEGRYHQVKRMFAAVGNRVVSLHRQAIGSVELDPDLVPGEYRALTEAEVSSLGGALP